MTLEQLTAIMQRAKQYKEIPLDRLRGFLKDEDGALDVRHLCEGIDACLDGERKFSAEDVLLLVVLHFWSLGKRPRVAIVDYGNVGAIDRGGCLDGILAVVRSNKDGTEPLTPAERHALTDPNG